MTARTLELIGTADVIVYDRLIPPTALDGARADAELIYVGKEGGGPSMDQAAIEAVLVQRGASGLAVLRLKGGDPFVFGRGGEEAETLRAAGIEFEVVPGVTAGVAAPAYAGIPVTHRDAASAVAFVTGHEDPTKPESALDWRALAAFPGTIVVYMGVRQLEANVASLLEAGRRADEPAALIERGTFPTQRAVVGTLSSIASLAAAEGVRAPAIAVFGEVAALRSRLAWFEHRPLAGLSVAVTRATAQASGLASKLSLLGASVVEAPAIRTRELDVSLPDFAQYDLVCVTSPNGARILLSKLFAAGLDARALAGRRIAVIGPATAAALRGGGIVADVFPARAVAESLVEELGDVPVRRALVARAASARDVLPDALRERGAEVHVLALYETVIEPLEESVRAPALAADYVTFTSASTVRNYLQSIGGAGSLSAATRIVSIGPVTSDELLAHGVQPHVTAAQHDVDGLVEALLADAGTRA
jgi:uroporphyrinogen III methyltransferase/synthase